MSTFFSGYELLSFFFSVLTGKKIKRTHTNNPLQRSRKHVLSATFNLFPSCVPFFGSAGQHQTHALEGGGGGGGGIILHGPIFAEARRAVHSYSQSDDSFDYGSIKSNLLIHLFPFERRDNE